MARGLRCTRIIKATQGHPNLLSEKQAATRLGARITLLRAREAGRIRFFRIGTRVLYCDEQLTEFLRSCERNRHKDNDGGEGDQGVTRREEKTIESALPGDQYTRAKR